MKKILILAFVLSSFLSHAQKTELGIIAGISLYSGDISPKEFGLYFQGLNPALGFMWRYNANRAFSIRLSATYTNIDESDDEIGNTRRDLSFKTTIREAELMFELNLFRLGNAKGVQVVPYLFGGVGVFNFTPKALFEDTWVDLQPLGTEGQGLSSYEAPYNVTQLNIPIGGGIKFIFNERWTLGAEISGRKLFTDYLDDVSGNTVNYLDIYEGNGEIAAILSNPSIKSPEEGDVDYTRGGEFMDWYYFTNITLSFKFGRIGGSSGGKGIGCPTNF